MFEIEIHSYQDNKNQLYWESYMTHLRERWAGVSLSGNYTLEQWLGGDDGAAYFQTSLAPDGRHAVVKLVPERAGDGDRLLNLWQRIRQLRHPNLVELLDCGRADLDGELAFYALFESPDDTLASALSGSPLNQQEARDVLDSIVDALRYLHAQGLAAGALDPDHIVAIGERVKLSTGALREAETSYAYREDVRLLGELWQHALLPACSKSAEIAAHAADPNAETRWTLAEISSALAAVYKEEPIVALPPPSPPLEVQSPAPAPSLSEAPVSEPQVPEAQVFEEHVSEDQVPAAKVSEERIPEAVVSEDRVAAAHATRSAPPLLPTSHRRTPESDAPSGFPKWIIFATAGLVLLILGLHWLPPAKVATQSKVTPVSLPVATAAPIPLPKSTPAKPTLERTAKPSPSDDQRIWRVIAFTYRTREAAAQKARDLNEYHPGINAAVFQPKNNARYYLVSLGGRMTREEAEHVQRSARGRGLPRDLYVQNYSR